MIRGLEWEVTGVCNYDCSYCCAKGQYGLERRHVDDDVVVGVLDMIAELPGEWVVKFGGAEPTIYPAIMELASAVVGLGHKVSITSNLSKSVNWWKRFAGRCKGRLEYVTVSLHLGQVDPDEFCWKVEALAPVLPNLQASSVVVDDNLGILQSVENQVRATGATWCYQVLREDGQYREYSPDVWAYIEDKLCSPSLYTMDHNSGTFCYAGDVFFRVLLSGDCVRCYELGVDNFHLGNVTDGTFKRLSGPMRCGSPRCTCTVPADQGAICTSV